MYLEPLVEPRFHADSYGYRPDKSALDALADMPATVLEVRLGYRLDVQKFFDTVSWDLMVKAVAGGHRLPLGAAVCGAVAEAPLQRPDGTLVQRDKGTPQGSAISPVLANLFHALWVRCVDGQELSGPSRSSASRTMVCPER